MSDGQDPTKPGDVPDLELGPLLPRRTETAKPPAAPSAAPAPPKASAAAGPLDYFGGGFDEDHFGSGSAVSHQGSSGAYDGGSMDLDGDDDQANLSLELKGSYRPPAPEPSAPPPGAPPTGTPPAPVARSLAPALPAVDQSAVGLVARYGPVPSAIYLAPLYAYRVLTRQRELKQELARIDHELRAQERELDERFAAVASAERPRLEADPAFTAAFEPVRQLESIAGERGAQLAETNQAFKAQNDQLEEQLRAVHAQVPPLDAEKARAEAAVAEGEGVLSRVAAKQKRFLIEARAVKMSASSGQAAQPGTQPALTPEQASQVQALESQAAAVQPEVDQAKQALAAAQAALQNVRNQLGALGQHGRRIQDQQKALVRQFQGQLNQASAGFSDAQQKLTQALAEVGRSLVAQAGAAPDPALLSAIRTGEANLKRLTEANVLHLAALDAYDREAVKKGYLVAGAVVGAVLLLLVLLLVL